MQTKKAKLNNEVMKLLSNAGFDHDIVGYVTSTVIKNLSEKNGKQQTYRAIISQYGQDKGLHIYNHIMKLL